MEEFKGTPGPWSKNQYGEAVDSTGEIIHIWGVALSNGCQAKANANLVISAPELLAALQGLIANYDEFRVKTGRVGQPQHKVILNARAAIAKAIGK